MSVLTIPLRLSALKAPASSLAAYCGFTGGQLSGYLNGSVAIPGNRLEQLNSAIADFEHLAKLAAPLPVNFSDVNGLRECLQSLKEGRLRIAVALTEPPAHEKAFAVQFRTQAFFQEKKNGEIIATNSFFNAAMMTKAVADKLILILAQKGYAACRAVENKFASEGTAAELEMIWADEDQT